jgi:transposase-like protein
MPEVETKELAVRELGADQRAALESLLVGKSITETARSVGISRTTLYDWMRSDPTFRAAYNKWHDSLRESCQSRLLNLTDKATDAVEKALEAGDARTALQLLKGMGLIGERKIGPTDAEEIRATMELEQQRRNLDLKMRRELQALEDQMG